MERKNPCIFQEDDYSWSIRRVLAFIAVFLAAMCAWTVTDMEKVTAWYDYLPCMFFLGFSAACLFFTTAEHIIETLKVIFSKNKGGKDERTS